MDWPAHSRLTRAMAPIFNPWWCAAADAGPTLASFTTRFDETGTRVPVPPLANNATTEWRSRTEVPRRSGSIPYSSEDAATGIGNREAEPEPGTLFRIGSYMP